MRSDISIKMSIRLDWYYHCGYFYFQIILYLGFIGITNNMGHLAEAYGI